MFVHKEQTRAETGAKGHNVQLLLSKKNEKTTTPMHTRTHRTERSASCKQNETLSHSVKTILVFLFFLFFPVIYFEDLQAKKPSKCLTKNFFFKNATIW